jgi:hypothetical protein
MDAQRRASQAQPNLRDWNRSGDSLPDKAAPPGRGESTGVKTFNHEGHEGHKGLLQLPLRPFVDGVNEERSVPRTRRNILYSRVFLRVLCGQS